MYYFEPFYSLTENLKIATSGHSLPIVTEKIVVNHYYLKSREEYEKIKRQRGWACSLKHPYSDERFKERDRNEEFDDGILKYRDAREKNFSLEGYADKLDRVADNLIKTVSKSTDEKVFDLETALTCRALSSYLREQFPNDADYFRICEKTSLELILNASKETSFTEARLFLSELPNILALPYPIVRELRNVAIKIIPEMMNILRINSCLRDYYELDYLRRLLQTWK